MAGPSGPAFLYNFYPRSPCGERPLCNVVVIDQCHFYPRSPCGERPRTTASAAPTTRFLSTLSLRRATPGKIRIFNDIFNFYPRSPCGERREVIAVMTEAQSISIHALLAESDQNGCGQYCIRAQISIHALLAESDSKSAQNSGALLRI